ncbi:hypothetical protein KCP73_25810 [Salmonella enterica subsp. enterica]|nr:hypothetical protein KCP73_25810 [Salmonella enterica subsp. enterica]
MPLTFSRSFRPPARNEQTAIVTRNAQAVARLDTPAAVSVIMREEDMRLWRRRALIYLRTLMASRDLRVQNRQNYAQDLPSLSRGFGSRLACADIHLYVDGIPATMPDGQGQISNIDATWHTRR